ncbi:MAG: polysaccharide pyruvyl transferase family protein, partial [Spirochaetales bacterium]|nr:polysaccharide pyruvyl transferase family protein [Spirochaetales bacterium]
FRSLKKSLSVLQQLTDKNIEVVVDPVLLMTADEWTRSARETKNKGKYILCYLLGDSTQQREALKRVAKKLHLPILTFPHIFLNVVRKCDLFFGDIRDYSSGPREFIELIKNAEMVITDSFHACVFSMIFKTPFAVFERNKIGENGNMNSRIYDFLEEYHLENQLVTTEELTEMKEIPKIDFTYAHEHWEKRRQESLYYLGNALKDNRYGRE